MRLFGDFCSNWTLKKSAILFGCAEVCDCGVFFYILWLTESEGFICAELFVLCLGIFVAYMYGLFKVISIHWQCMFYHINYTPAKVFWTHSFSHLQNSHRFLVLLSSIQSFVLFLYSTHYFIRYMLSRRLKYWRSEISVMDKYVYPGIILAMVVGNILQQINRLDMKWNS